MLVQWVAAPAAGTAAQASADQLLAATVTDLGGRLLNAIMTLYGVLVMSNTTLTVTGHK